MIEAATLRSGYDLKDSTGFADRVESMLRRAMGVSLDEKVEEEPVDEETTTDTSKTPSEQDSDLIDEDDILRKSTTDNSQTVR